MTVKQEQVAVKREQVDAATAKTEQARGQADTESAHAASAQGEVEQLQRCLECCVCLDARVCVLLMPCGHRLCQGCASSVSVCPQCQKTVNSHQAIF